MTRPPFPLVVSGRRPSAGPEHQFGRMQASATLIVIALVATLLLGPALIAVLSMIFAGRLDGPSVQPIVPFQLILESGRVLVTLALVAKVIKTGELE